MTQLSKQQIIAVADQLGDAIKNWKLIEQGGGKFVVFRVPNALEVNASSPADGEPMRFWRFDVRHAAERFRNRKIAAELSPTMADAQ